MYGICMCSSMIKAIRTYVVYWSYATFQALNHSFAYFRCSYHMRMIKTGFCYFCCQISRYVYIDYMGYMTAVLRARAFISMECLVIKTQSICRLCYIFLISVLFCCLSFSHLSFRFLDRNFFHQTYKCQVQPIWWADISHWYFIIVLNLHIIFPFFYDLHHKHFIHSFAFLILMVSSFSFRHFIFAFAVFCLFIIRYAHIAPKKVVPKM